MDAQAKEIKTVMCEINSFAIVYFFFDDILFNYKLKWPTLIKYDIVFLNREKQKRELLNKIY
jgi:hypothetical protein